MAARLRLPALGWPALAVALAGMLGLAAAARPVLAVAAAIGLAFALLLVSDLTVGLCLFTLVSFVDVLPGGTALSVAKVVGLLLALTWLATIATREDAKGDFFSAHPGAVYVIVLFVAWAALSALWAESSGEALTVSSRFGLNVLLFPIVYAAIRRPQHVTWIAWVFVGGALFSTAFGIVVPQPTEEGRLTGAIGEANELASVLVAAFVIAAAIAITSRRGSAGRAVALGAAAICVGGVLLSLSRSGLLALGIVLIGCVLLSGRWRPRAAALGLAALLAAGIYLVAFTTTYERERITRLQGGAGRVDLWTVGWRMVEDRPLTGVGAGNYIVVSPNYLLSEPGAIVRTDFILDDPKQTHNIYLQVLAELGIPGLLLFLSVIGFSLACARRAAHAFRALGDARLESLSWAFFLAALGILVSDFFQSEQFSKQLWLLLALGPALLGLARRREREELA